MIMKTTGRTGVAMTAMLSLLLVAGHADEEKEQRQDTGPNAISVVKTMPPAKTMPSEETVPVKKGEPAKVLDLVLAKGVSMKFARLKAGKFTMGSPETEKDRYKNEGPQHQVTLTRPFYMGVTEVTQAQWKVAMNTQPWQGRATKTGADHAAVYISWDDAVAFCKTVSKTTGRTVRLPTEAEWEYACRAGTTTTYGFGDDASKLSDYEWYYGNAYAKGEKYAHTVGRKKPNAWGLYDMHGNVGEWCADWYAGPYANADVRDPKGPASGFGRICRGGDWVCFPSFCRAAYRPWAKPDVRATNGGFRVVVESGSGVD